MAKTITTDDLRAALTRRQLGPEEQGHRAFHLEEVELGGRRADAISVGLWRSRGQFIDGFEIKQNRRDWLSEYEDHSKAEPAMAVCDRFWLVTVPEVLHPGELPESWGLLILPARNRKLVVEKPAPLLREDCTKPVDREALVRLLRRVADIGVDARNAVFDEARKEAESRVDFDRKRLEDVTAHAEQDARELREGWQAFHAQLGLEPWKWRPTKEDMELLGKMARAIREGDEQLERFAKDLRRLEDDAGALSGRLNDTLGELNQRLYGNGQAA